MSQLVSRILLSIFMFPVAGIFYTFVVVCISDRGNGGEPAFLAASGITWMIAALYWWLVWRSGIKWTPRRRVLTVAAIFPAALFGIMAGVLTRVVTGEYRGSFAEFIGGTSAIIAWLIMTVFVWRETATERAERVRSSSKSAITCPNCGYNLTGLSESRCPECGTKYTLDELVALQPEANVEVD